jgi:ABC-type uncharacterized transport system substrate-binding protein
LTEAHATPRPSRAHCRVAWWPGVLLALLVLSSANRASGASIAIVRTSDADPYQQAAAAVRDQLSRRGQDVKDLLLKDVEQRGVDQAIGKVDGIVAVGTSAAHWLHKALPTTQKLLYCMVSNPREAGLLEGGPASGVTTDVSNSAQIQIIAQALPGARVLGVLYRSDSAEGRRMLAALQKDLPTGWRAESVAVNECPSFAEAISTLMGKSPDVVWTTADGKLYDSAAVRALLLASLRARIPVWGFSPAFVRAGALVGVGVDPHAQGEQAADLLQQCLDDPAQIKRGPQPPREFQIAVNLIVAQQLGISLPDSLTNRAAHVYGTEK